MKEAQKIEMDSNKIAAKIQKLFEQLKENLKKLNPSADTDEVDRLIMAAILGTFAR